MKTLLLAFLFYLALVGRAQGQQLAWERAYSWYLDDDFVNVLEAEPGYFIACGTRWEHRHVHGTTEIPVVSLVKFDLNGDTLWKKDIGFDGDSPRICRGEGNTFYLLSDVWIGIAPEEVMLFQLDFDGQITSRVSLGQELAVPKRLIRASDGSLVYISYSGSLPNTGNQLDMVVTRFDATTGVMHWQNRYSPHPFTRGNWVEETPDHHFLASGNAGSYIWAVEIDSAGYEVRSCFFYRTPSNIVFDELACVQQAPGGRYIVSGNMLNRTYRRYLACHEGFSSNKVWGGETEVSYGLPPHVNADSSIALVRTNSATCFLTRLDKDSLTVWDVDLQSRLGSSRPPVINAFAYQADSSVVAVGSIRFSAGGPYDDLYLCRILHVGLPYEPAVPTATRPQVAAPPALSAYPCPTQGPLSVRSRSREALTLLDASGRAVIRANADASGTTRFDLSDLPAGLYLLRQGGASARVARL